MQMAALQVLEVVDCLASALGDLALVLFVTPAILVSAVPLVFGYLRVQNLYIATSRELKRLDSIALSPIFSNFSESLSGLMSIRAFQKQNAFVVRNMTLIDQSNKAWWPMQVHSQGPRFPPLKHLDKSPLFPHTMPPCPNYFTPDQQPKVTQRNLRSVFYRNGQYFAS